MRLYFLVLGLVALFEIVLAQPFLYTQFPDQMEDAFLDRKNAFTVSSYYNPNTIITGFGDSDDNLILQMYSNDPINFPPQPVDPRKPYAEGFKIPPAGVGSVTAVMFFTDYVFLAVQTLGGMIVTLGTRENGTNNMVPFAFQEFNWTRSEFQNGPRPLDLTHQVQFTRAIAMDEFSKPRIALSARFNSNIYKLIVFNFTTDGFDVMTVVDIPDDAAGVPDIIPFPSASDKRLTTLLLAYPYQISATNWGIATWRTEDTFNFVQPYYFSEVRARAIIRLRINGIYGNYWALTAMYLTLQGPVLQHGIIDDISKVLSPITIVNLPGALYTPFTPHVLFGGTVVIVWTQNGDNQTIYGCSIQYGTESLPVFNFKIPAATNTNLIDEFFISPLENTTFAITQVVRNSASPSGFINYYALSDCNDTVTTPNENCNDGEGCVQCMCDRENGWHAFDGFVCITRCEDSITAGNETCLDSKDQNCKNCQCAEGFAINTNTSKCAGIVQEPGPDEGFPMPLIAAFVLGPVGLGAIIFIAVFFGKKHAKKNQKKGNKVVSSAASDDIPLTPTGTGAYTAVPSIQTEVRTNDNKYGAISARSEGGNTNRTVDRMNVPYTNLKFIKEIGSGAYGKVFIGEWQRTKVALKINTLASGEEFAREAKLMVDLRPHPNVVQMLGVSSDGPYPVMILEFCDGGSLDTKLFQTSEVSNLSEQLLMISGIAKGLYHLHKNQIVHRDMAARNILLNFNQPKISDFGLSRLVNDTQKGTTRSNVGPIRWMSPESLKNQTYSTTSDVWSFGVVVYEIVARKEPHADADQMAIGLQIRDNGITPKIPEDCDPCLRELLEKCWQLDPDQRPTMEQICDILDKYMEDNNW